MVSSSLARPINDPGLPNLSPQRVSPIINRVPSLSYLFRILFEFFSLGKILFAEEMFLRFNRIYNDSLTR